MPKLGGRMASASRVNGSHQRSALASAACCVPNDAKKHVFRDALLEEEIEWLERQRLSGAVGRQVSYTEGHIPQEDIFFRGGGQGHVVVASVRDGGNAYREGIRAGDRLVAIDGRKDFLGMTANAVHQKLKAPTVLVFLGFVGKKHAEVRLSYDDINCGVSGTKSVTEAVARQNLFWVCEEKVFDAGNAPIFMAAQVASTLTLDQEFAKKSFFSVFELQQHEAQQLVMRAVDGEEEEDDIAQETDELMAAIQVL